MNFSRPNEIRFLKHALFCIIFLNIVSCDKDDVYDENFTVSDEINLNVSLDDKYIVVLSNNPANRNDNAKTVLDNLQAE